METTFPTSTRALLSLDTLLHQGTCQALLHEVYQEIDELDRQAQGLSGNVTVDSANGSGIDVPQGRAKQDAALRVTVQ